MGGGGAPYDASDKRGGGGTFPVTCLELVICCTAPCVARILLVHVCVLCRVSYFAFCQFTLSCLYIRLSSPLQPLLRQLLAASPAPLIIVGPARKLSSPPPVSSLCSLSRHHAAPFPDYSYSEISGPLLAIISFAHTSDTLIGTDTDTDTKGLIDTRPPSAHVECLTSAGRRLRRP